jgi:hypothetical protein
MAALVLGGISFAGFEIPNQINFGGKHNLVVHELIGGTRVLDAMGSKPDQIKWNGRFRGASAVARAQAIDELRISGAQVDLAWLNVFRTVVVVGFTAQTEKAYEVPYEVQCEVVNDAADGFGSIFQSIDGLISSDIAAAAGFTASPAASAVVATLGAALANIGPIGGSTAAARTAATLAANIATNGLKSAAVSEDIGLSITMPTDLPVNMAAWLSAQSLKTQVHSGTLDVLGYVARIGSNIATVKS